jgi:hypothetical protein
VTSLRFVPPGARGFAAGVGVASVLCASVYACGAFSLDAVVPQPDGSIIDAGGSSDGDASSEGATPPCDGGGDPCSCLSKTLVSSGNGPVVAFQIDPNYAYWLAKDEGKSPSVCRSLLTGDGGVSVIAPSFSWMTSYGMSLDSQYVYSAQTSAGSPYLVRVPVGGGVMTPFSVGLPSVESLQAGPGGLYWADTEADVCTAALDGAIPPGDSGCGGAPFAPGSADAASTAYNSLVSADASLYLSLYWTGEIWRVSTADGQETLVVASDLHDAYRKMAATDTDLFFAQKLSGDAGTVVHVAATGGAATVLVQTGPVQSLTIDDASVYYVVGAQIAKTPRNGGASTVVGCDEQGQPAFVAVDNQWVYWANAGDGRVWKAPK